MAALTDEQKIKVVRDFMRDSTVSNPNVDKLQLFAAVQAIEDEMETNVKPTMNTVITTALGSGTLTNPEKKKLYKHYLPVKFNLE